jgi:hypothetical protein
VNCDCFGLFLVCFWFVFALFIWEIKIIYGLEEANMVQQGPSWDDLRDVRVHLDFWG